MIKQIVVTQGEHRVSDAQDVVISTLLGSCVACCLWDADARAGGMNHILLATNSSDATVCNLAGVNAMELLINDLLKLGARRSTLQAKVFGGAQMIEGLSNIGPENSAFALRFLAQEGIPVRAKSLGGRSSRHVVFTPATGAARVKMTQQPLREEPPRPEVPVGNGIELL